jgi:hypothetical protein
MWFEKLTGFREESPEQVRANLRIEGDAFVSLVNNRRMRFGRLEVTTLEALRQRSAAGADLSGRLQLSEVVGNVQTLHTQPENAHALFQAASQFNLLEMVEPNTTPEAGIGIYEYDHTQGPACAIACGAGTIYRNYFAPVGDQIGQTESNQIDCLSLIGAALQNDEYQYWTMRNGYALLEEDALLALGAQLSDLTDAAREALKGQLQVGIQWNTEVTLHDSGHPVSQIYCSALPVAYCDAAPEYWEPFARLILEATYEATLHTARINLQENGSKLAYLTRVGGGAFGNEETWILESLEKALRQFETTPLDVQIVSYSAGNAGVGRLVAGF